MEHARVVSPSELIKRRHPRAPFSEYGYIAGTVQVEGAPVRRRVRCIERKTGRFIAETWSGINGAYRFDDLVPGRQYLIVAMDYELLYNAVVADNVQPVIGAPIQPPAPGPEVLVAPGGAEIRYNRDTASCDITWRNANHTQQAVRIYRDTAPIDPGNLPIPLVELGPFERSYSDDSVTQLESYYWRLSVVRNGLEVVGEQIETLDIGSSPFEGLEPGTYMESEGGYFTAVMLDENDEQYGLITPPKAGGERSATTNWATAMSWCDSLDLNGKNDWRLPTLDELIIQYRAYKPTTNNNNTSSGATDRVDPPLDNYTSSDPSQTSLDGWRANQTEAFIELRYWSATEAGTSAWYVTFDNGNQSTFSKTNFNFVRAVRRVYF